MLKRINTCLLCGVLISACGSATNDKGRARDTSQAPVVATAVEVYEEGTGNSNTQSSNNDTSVYSESGKFLGTRNTLFALVHLDEHRKDFSQEEIEIVERCIIETMQKFESVSLDAEITCLNRIKWLRMTEHHDDHIFSKDSVYIMSKASLATTINKGFKGKDLGLNKTDIKRMVECMAEKMRNATLKQIRSPNKFLDECFLKVLGKKEKF